MSDSLFPAHELPSASQGGDAWYTAHCDGGSRGNPGPAGYGAVIEDPQGRIVARLSEYLGKQTNNFAEYSGLLAVLHWAIENRTKCLRVVSDSELMVKQMKGIYKVKNPGLLSLWEEAKRLAGGLERFQMTHTLRGGNKEADRLANDAMDRGMGRGQGTGIREQGAGGSAQQFGSAANPARAQAPKPTRQVFEGLVKNGVVHLIEGELPDGILVKVIRE
ncbi:MAG TPA: ribonuclease HI family protein [Terracidiphilus sp.]|jgi:ribonuclease HI|nr:ribonuclease HI family protein [Terracidiphilus sp.]